MKAITPVIALVMLVMITISLVGTAFIWFSGILGGSTKKSISIPPGGAYCADGDIKVYVLNNGDTAITASDIIIAQVDGVDIKNTPFFGDMKSGLVGYWKFDEAGGTTATDSSGNNNNGNLQPAPCPGNCPERIGGKSRGALKFDGVNDYVEVLSSNIGTTDQLTIRLWVNPSDQILGSFTYSNDIIRSNKYGAGIWGISTDDNFNTNNLLMILVGWMGPNSGAWWEPSTATVTKGSWNDVTLTLDRASPGKAVFYRNGIKTDEFIPGAITLPKPTTTGFGIASDWAGEFKGVIDEVKIYNNIVGDVKIQPGKSGVIVNYPGVEGRHTIRVATPANAAEATVSCA